MKEEERRAYAEEIVEQQALETLEEAKRFAIAWVETAMFYADNADYWKSQAEVGKEE